MTLQASELVRERRGQTASIWNRAIVIEFPAGLEGKGQDVLKQVEKEAPWFWGQGSSTLPFSVRDSTGKEQQGTSDVD